MPRAADHPPNTDITRRKVRPRFSHSVVGILPKKVYVIMAEQATHPTRTSKRREWTVFLAEDR
jgi:hypothetical protein